MFLLKLISARAIEKKPHSPFHALFVVLALVGSTNVNTLNARVTYDGNGAGALGTSLAFTVPAGTDRLLVIAVCADDPISNVAYNGINATLAVTETGPFGVLSSMYYIPLGSGASITSTITATTIGSVFVGAGSFQNIDQGSPLGNTNSTDGDITGPIITPSLNVSSTAGNLVIDKFVAAGNSSPSASQTLVFSVASAAFFASGFKIATSGTTTMSYTFGGGASDLYTYSAVEFVASSTETNINQAVASLNDYVNSAGLSSSTARAITRRLDLAAYKYCTGSSVSSVVSLLNNIIGYVEYHSGSSIPTADADYIIGEIQALISALNSGTAVCEPVNRPGGPGVANFEPELAEDFQLFPNPAGSAINLSVGSQMGGPRGINSTQIPQGRPALIRIYNTQGQLIMERQCPSLEAGELTFDVDQFSPGMYNLVVAVDGELPVTKKFVVQR